MNSNTIAIRITVNDDGSHVIQQFGANASRGFQKAEQSANLTTTAFQTMKRTYFELTAAAAAVSVAAYKVADALMASAKASIEMERLRVAMESALGSSTAMSSAIGFIRAESDRLGLSFQDQTKAYTKLAAAAKGTNLEGQKTRDIFSAIAEASTALQLSSDETSGALYAISQMISKGKVSSEELRQQLGERLPGAFNLAAKAMGVTAAELDKMLQQGEVYAGDFLPRFAAAIREHYAGAIEKASDSTSANIERMKTAFFDLKVSIGDTFGNETAALIRGLTGLLRDMESAVYRVQGAIGKMVAYYDSIPDWIKTAAKLGGKAFMGSPFKSASYPSMADEAKALGIASGQTQQAHLESLVAGRPAGGSSGGGSSKASKGLSDVEKAAKKAAEEYERLSEKADKFVRKAAQDVELGSLTGLRKALRENEIEYENTLKIYEKLTGTEKNNAIAAAESIKAMKDRQAVEKETEDQRKKAVDAAKEIAEWEKLQADIIAEQIEAANKLAEAYQRISDNLIALRSSYEPLLAIEEEHRKKVGAVMEAWLSGVIGQERYNKLIDQLLKDKAYQELTVYTDTVRANAIGLRDMADGMAMLYGEGSSAANRWTEEANALEIAQRAVAVVNAVAAVAAASAAPFPAGFVAGAGMLAAMGSLLASIGESIGGGGGSSSGYSGPSYSGRSTVLGAADDVASQSLQNSLEILQDTYSMEYNQLRKLNDQMEALNNNITGLVASIFMNGDLGAINIKTGISGTSNLTPLRKLDKDLFGGAGFDFFSGNWLGDLGGWNFGGKLFEGIFNWLGNALFGGKTETKISKQGLGVSFTQDMSKTARFGNYEHSGNRYSDDLLTIGEMLAGGQATVYNYVRAKATTDGGWLGSDSTKKIYQAQAASGDVTAMFNLVFSNMAGTLVELSKGLGADLSSVLNYTFDSFKLNLRDMSGDEITKAIQAQISKMADTAASRLFGDIIRQYQQVNEGLYETAVRLVTDKAVIEEIIGMTGQRFPDIAASAIELSEALIDIAGSLSDLQESASNYFDKFYTDQEKHLYLQDQLNDAMNDMGLSLATSRDGYRAMVEALDLTAESGRYAYVTMMSMADYADQYYKYLEDQAESFDQEMQNNASLFRTREDYIRALNTGKSEDTPEARDRKEMLAELKQLRTAMEAQGYQTVKNTKKTADTLEEWKILGMPVTQAA